MSIPRLFVLVCALLLPGVGPAQDENERPKLTAIERSQGWKYLFDGGSLSDWRGYQQNRIPANWSVAGGWLTTSGGTALVSEESFQDFELQFDWKVAEGGVGEVCLRVDEDIDEAGSSGLLVELEGGSGMGGNGGISELWRTRAPQPGLWHRTKVTVYGNQVEHWIDGDRVLTYMVDTPDWRAAVAGSRFGNVNGYGLAREGRIVLHGRDASFRNIKVRSL